MISSLQVGVRKVGSNLRGCVAGGACGPVVIAIWLMGPSGIDIAGYRYSEQARKEGEIRIGYGARLGNLRGMGGCPR